MAIANPDIDYYHINRIVPWSQHKKLNIGDEFDVGEESNPYFRYFETHKKIYPVTNITNGSTINLSGVKFIGDISKGLINLPDMSAANVARIAHDILNHFVSYLREIIWEDVRKTEFPHLPSRQRCIWLIPDIEGVKYWLSRLELQSPDYQVLRLNLQGRLHQASELYLLGDSEPMEETIIKVRKYWRGLIEQPGTEEIIF